MAYFAVYDIESGEIQNIIECPEFLSTTIHHKEIFGLLFHKAE